MKNNGLRRETSHSQKTHILDLERLLGWLVFVTVLVSTSYFFPRWADQNSNSRLDMVVAVVDDGTFQIDRYVHNTVDYARVGDHYYSDKAPGAALLGIPVYASLRWIFETPLFPRLVSRLESSAAFQDTLRAEGSGVLAEKVQFALAQVALTIVLASLPSALTAWMLYRLGRRWIASPLPRAAVAIGSVLLTPAFAYGQALYGHQLSAALLVGSLMVTIDQGRDLRVANYRLGLAGLFLAYAVITEYPAFLAAAAISAFILYRLVERREIARLVWFVLPAVLVMGGWMYYNQAIFGGPLNLGYSYSEQWVTAHSTGFMSLTTPTLAAAWGITFGGFRGLFYYSPVLLLGLAGFFVWWKDRQDRALFWTVVFTLVMTFLFNASSVMWWGGFAVGPRYLLTSLPFLAVPFFFAIRAWGNSSVFRVSAVLLGVWSLLATWGMTLAGQAYPSDLVHNPLIEYGLPSWASGDIARSAGTLLGLSGPLSLLPLGIFFAVAGVIVWWGMRYRRPAGQLLSQKLPVQPDPR